MKEEKYLGRIVKEKYTFKKEGTFQSMYAAHEWLHENDYSWGSTCKDRLNGGNCPVEIQKGDYGLPQKWIHFAADEELLADGVIVSNDFREGEVIVYIFN